METHAVTSLQRERCAIGFACYVVHYCPEKAHGSLEYDNKTRHRIHTFVRMPQRVVLMPTQYTAQRSPYISPPNDRHLGAIMNEDDYRSCVLRQFFRATSKI